MIGKHLQRYDAEQRCHRLRHIRYGEDIVGMPGYVEVTIGRYRDYSGISRPYLLDLVDEEMDALSNPPPETSHFLTACVPGE